MKYFTHYWKNKTWRKVQAEANGEPLDQTSGNLFTKRGVDMGDAVYVVTIFSGQLFVCGKMVVGDILNLKDAAKHFNYKPSEMWQAKEHLIDDDAMPMRFDLSIPHSASMKLRFRSRKGLKQLKCDAPGVLNSQAIRAVREITKESAAILDEFLET